MARRKRREPEFEDDGLDDLMLDDDDDDKHAEPAPPRRSVWYWIFIAPGSLMLWLQYMYASPETYWVSARRRKSRFFQVSSSIVFWVLLFIFVGSLLARFQAPTTTP